MNYTPPSKRKEKLAEYEANRDKRLNDEKTRCKNQGLFHWDRHDLITGFYLPTKEDGCKSSAIGTRKLLAMLLLLPMLSFSQPFIDAGAGLSTRLGITAKVDAGYISANRNYSGLMIAATTIVESGFGANYGAFAGWQWYGIALYAGGSKWASISDKMENQKALYPIAGITYRYPENRGNIDLRYQANSIYLTFNLRIGKNHNL